MSSEKHPIDTPSLNFNLILNELPFGVSVQTIDRKIIYENKKVKELVGSFLYRQCYNRWHYIEERGNEPCEDCPATIGFEDKLPHRIFRKTFSEDGENFFVEINFIPLFNEEGELDKFIEVIQEVEIKDKARVLTEQSRDTILQQIQVSIIKFGDLGGESITTDKLRFIKQDEIEDFLTKVTVYIFSGLIQGFDEQEGLFGPLPVLDITTYEMLAHLFKIKNKDAKDLRMQGLELCMIFIFFPRDYFFLFNNRDEIENFIHQQIELWENLENITDEIRNDFTNRLHGLLSKQI